MSYEEEVWIVEYRFEGTSAWYPNPQLVFGQKELAELAAVERESAYSNTSYRATRYLPEHL